jgi:hypothetical protein
MSRFIEGLEQVDQTRLPPDEARRYQSIIETARAGNWDDEEFLDNLGSLCQEFTAGQPHRGKP